MGDMWLTAFLSYLKAENKDQEVVDWIDTEFGIWLKTYSQDMRTIHGRMQLFPETTSGESTCRL